MTVPIATHKMSSAAGPTSRGTNYCYNLSSHPSWIPFLDSGDKQRSLATDQYTSAHTVYQVTELYTTSIFRYRTDSHSQLLWACRKHNAQNTHLPQLSQCC